MSVLVKPVEQLEFLGVSTGGNPIQRPRNTAEVCENFRVMPGNYLRLRSGRWARYNTIGGSLQQIYPFRNVDFWGSDMQLAQVSFSGSPAWHWFNLLNYVIAPQGMPGVTQVETIGTAYDGGFANSNPVAVCNLNDRPVFYNGLGVRDGTNSRPALSHHLNGSARYFGLDCYVNNYPPTVTVTNNVSGYNKYATGMKIYIGLWHRPTDHYSNGFLIFNDTNPQSVNAIITVTNLNYLTYATHGSSESSELFYVFYATIDGGQVPYLIMNSSLNGPYSVAVTGGSANLSITPNTTNGWVLDFTSEMPTKNFPPRPMRALAYVNGRLYGALMTGGYQTMSLPDFSYIPRARDLAAVCWSAAASDSVDTNFVGDPLQSWPMFNLAYTPSGDQPLALAPSLDGSMLLVITPTSTFYLQEQADGIHEYTTISRVHGIKKSQTLRTTRYGMVWVDQRNQIVLLARGSLDIQVLSSDYQNLLSGNVRCADYILDPESLVDRYQVWLDNNTSVCHDFLINGPGKAYSCSNHDFTVATSAVDSMGRKHHIVAKTGLYTHETQPEGGIPVTDISYNNTSDQTATVSEITGTYIRNWDDFGDCDQRKELPMVDVYGDGDSAASLGDVSPIEVSWYGDFEEVKGDNKKLATGARITQSTTVSAFRYKLASANRFWYKLVFKLAGHSTENGGVSTTYPSTATEGNKAKNFYGSILRFLWRLGVAENRA